MGRFFCCCLSVLLWLLWHCCDFGRPSLICTLAGESAGLAGESDARHWGGHDTWADHWMKIPASVSFNSQHIICWAFHLSWSLRPLFVFVKKNLNVFFFWSLFIRLWCTAFVLLAQSMGELVWVGCKWFAHGMCLHTKKNKCLKVYLLGYNSLSLETYP